MQRGKTGHPRFPIPPQGHAAEIEGRLGGSKCRSSKTLTGGAGGGHVARVEVRRCLRIVESGKPVHSMPQTGPVLELRGGRFRGRGRVGEPRFHFGVDDQGLREPPVNGLSVWGLIRMLTAGRRIRPGTKDRP